MGMLEMLLLRGALSAFSALFGGLGMFCLFQSFSRPHFAMYALMFLGAATAIQLSFKKRTS